MLLANGHLQVEIDEKTGSIIRLVDLATGVVHLDARADGRDDGRLFRIMSPVAMQSSRHADSHSSPAPVIERDGHKLVMRWAGLAAGEGELAIRVEVVVELPPGADELRLSMRLHNNSDCEITDMLFPWLGGWRGVGGPGRDEMIIGGVTGLDPHGFPINCGTTYIRMHQRQSFRYPVGGLYCPWADISGPAGGLSYVSYQTTGRNITLMLENLAGYEPGLFLSFGWTHHKQLQPGQEWESPPVGIAVHGGDWHETADRYTRWVDTWFEAPPTPPWARTAIGFQNVMFRSFDNTFVRSLEEIPAVARVGRKYGVDHLSIWDYMMLGNYSKHDDLDLLDYSDREKDILRRVLRQAREEGSHISSLINFRLTNPTSSLYRNGAKEELTQRYDGTAHQYMFAGSAGHPTFWTDHLGPMCHSLDPRVESYRQRVLRQVREYVGMGFSSIFYDQPFEKMPSYRRDVGDDGPDGVHPAALSLIHEVGDIMRQADGDAIVVGEYCDVFGAQEIDLWMSWYSDMRQVVRSAYSIPQTLQSYVVDNDPTRASLAFAMGLQLCLTTHGLEGTLADVPAFGEHVAALAKLRKTCSAYLCDGRFRDTIGIESSTDGPVTAFGFDSPQGPAVTLAASADGGKATVAIDRSAFTASSAGEGRLYRLDGRVDAVSKSDTLEAELDANEVAVWIP